MLERNGYGDLLRVFLFNVLHLISFVLFLSFSFANAKSRWLEDDAQRNKTGFGRNGALLMRRSP